MLDGGGALVVGAGDRVPGDLLGEGRLPYAGLAEGREDFGDVRQERAVGPEDEQSAAPDALRVGVEQVRRPVQADGGLAGAGGALHAHGDAQVPADEVVLPGLDGGRDVPHGPDAGPLDLPGDESADPRALLRLPLPPLQVLVLQPGQVGGLAPAAGGPAEPPAHGDALRIAGGGLVEGAGDGGPPVHDEGRGGGVLGDPQPPDVVALPGVAGARPGEVQPAEEQRPFGQLPQLLGPAAQAVPEDLGVGAGGGDVLAGEDLLVGAVDHGGEGGAAAVVVGAFPGEGVREGGLGRRHSTERTK
ncbi:hypothetical protein SGRIM128S_09649 [Streptomyces griseomycini]